LPSPDRDTPVAWGSIHRLPFEIVPFQPAGTGSTVFGRTDPMAGRTVPELPVVPAAFPPLFPQSIPPAAPVRVCDRLRILRFLSGLSRAGLARATGRTIRHIADSERGRIQIPPAHLRQCAEALCIPLAYFLDDGDRPGSPPTRHAHEVSVPPIDHRIRLLRQTLELIRHHQSTPPALYRTRLSRLIKAIGVMGRHRQDQG
jgi:transcriptional regulator with XRE-family HTH domain